MATLKDIAIEAGVSIMTVSNVINGKHSKVSDQTITSIQELVKKYNYVPNLSARSLSKKSSKLIAIFINSYEAKQNLFKDPYISELFGELESLIRQSGYYAIIRSVETVENVSTILHNWNVDGAIFISQQPKEAMNEILEHSKCPIVFIDSYNNDNPKAIMVGVNDYKGGYIATKYLISNGHRKIAFAGCYSETNEIVSQRYQGYRKALEESNIPYVEENLINTFTRYEDGINIGRDMANHNYDVSAVFAAADLLALGIIEGARINGCVVPNDLSVIGFDNLDLCSLVTPKLTTVSQDVKKKAESAVNLLLDAINQVDIPSQNITLDVQLEVRQTVQKKV
ncbi:LacI family DNA-binding transcriptional regulator [Anaeromicropila herbilytica]|uniref:LacI family transcriptional regulator n=1 Tax=Anaeromicropila herbilytica TaxID=2785025 RepID=A0A7R7IDF2_9FIRM|nr:LacI family DNA-binding transcriptional regulator [Anaeromicropila herbilytica]BCN31492.1 LacI family transcriptional regulator [Anaeromicropila herbilytica]